MNACCWTPETMRCRDDACPIRHRSWAGATSMERSVYFRHALVGAMSWDGDDGDWYSR